jgi:hypothetical protein
MALLNHGSPSPTSTATRVHHLGGLDLAYELRGTTADIRGKLAAAYAADGIVLHKPTDKQLAVLFRVSVFKLAQARNGKRGNGCNGHAESLVDHIARSTTAERLEAARVVGPALLWDTMISPVIAEDRAEIVVAAE